MRVAGPEVEGARGDCAHRVKEEEGGEQRSTCSCCVAEQLRAPRASDQGGGRLHPRSAAVYDVRRPLSDAVLVLIMQQLAARRRRRTAVQQEQAGCTTDECRHTRDRGVHQ